MRCLMFDNDLGLLLRKSRGSQPQDAVWNREGEMKIAATLSMLAMMDLLPCPCSE
jgi:hypothetical protein